MYMTGSVVSNKSGASTFVLGHRGAVDGTNALSLPALPHVPGRTGLLNFCNEAPAGQLRDLGERFRDATNVLDFNLRNRLQGIFFDGVSVVQRIERLRLPSFPLIESRSVVRSLSARIQGHSSQRLPC